MHIVKISKEKKYIFIFILISILMLINGTHEAMAFSEGKKAPLFSLKNIEGKKVKMTSDKKYILGFIHFSSKKCKDMLFFFNKINKKNTNIISVNLGPDKKGNLARLISKYKFKYEILLDPKLKTIKAYRVLVLPTIFLIDKRGVVQKKIIGFDQNVAKKIKAF